MKLLDMHCDTIEQLYHMENRNWKDTLRHNDKHIDLEKLQKSDYLLQNFAVFLDKEKMDNAFDEANRMIDLFYQEMEANKDLISPVFSFLDIADNRKKGKMSALLAVEGGEGVNGNLSFLRQLYRQGVRMMTLVWNYENEIGVPNLLWNPDGTPDFLSRNPNGLTEFGIELVQEMERLGMVIDVSHLSDGGFYDVVKYTEKPFVASHSNAASVTNVCRNLTDEMIRLLAERGGVTGLNFCGSFLITDAPEESEEATDRPKGRRTREPEKHGLSGVIKAESRLSDMVRHVRHIVDVGGIDVCALGSDFDGIPECRDIPDASYMQLLVDALEKAGFHTSEVEKICYKNALRVYSEIL